MKVSVMQPYLFPYLGYYQLINSVDAFVLYDDVSFIKQGYINRNNILMNGQPLRITVPVPRASQNKRIKDLNFSSDISKILKTIKHAYVKAPFFNDVYPIVERVLTHKDRNITTICHEAISEIWIYLEKDIKIARSSDLAYDRDLSAADRLIDLCGRLGSSHYVNSAGGRHLYAKDYFKRRGVKLSFLQMNEIQYSQGTERFFPNLSIIDVLMSCDKHHVREILNEYTLC